MTDNQSVIGRLKIFSERKNISIGAIERKSGITKGSLHNAIRENGSIGVDKIANILASYPELSPRWVLLNEGEMETTSHFVQGKSIEIPFSDLPKPLPFYDLQVFAGPVEVFLTDQPWLPDGIIYLPDVRLCDCALRVRGDSMAPVIENGDIIAVKLIQDMKGISWKKPYVIITDHHRLVKYLYKGEDEAHIILVSANRQYEPEVMPIQEVLFFYEVRTIIKEQHF